jgi:hypothetical protein
MDKPSRLSYQLSLVTVLSKGNDLERAVVPPPRLRAKWVNFSADLRNTLGGSGWALAWRLGGGRNLRNPARVDGLRNAYKHAQVAEFCRCLGKKVSYFLRGCDWVERPVFIGLET